MCAVRTKYNMAQIHLNYTLKTVFGVLCQFQFVFRLKCDSHDLGYIFEGNKYFFCVMEFQYLCGFDATGIAYFNFRLQTIEIEWKLRIFFGNDVSA